MSRSPDRFRRFAWFVVVYNLAVVLWGAFVRATGSGAGCGSHWPLCNGEVLPRAPSIETVIELTHRLMSAVDGLLVLALVIWAFRAFGRRHPVRRWSLVGLAFLISEALVGAGLVRFELVADNDSMVRALVMSAHLINTFLLLAALALAAEAAGRRRGGAAVASRGGAVAAVVAGGTLLLIAVGTTGAVTALGDTLFPAASFRSGLAHELSPTAHLLVRLRVIHPALALAAALLVPLAAARLVRRAPAPAVAVRARWVYALVAAQMVLGTVNLALAAPVWAQLVHLLLADLLWIAWVVLAAAAVTESAPAAAPMAAGPPQEVAVQS